MYTILINDDNTMYCTNKERIMQRSKCVDDLVFIVNSVYKNKYDMSNALVVLEYILPVSREYKTEYLTLSDERYKDCYLQYKLPFDTKLTKEAGKIELQLTFAYVDLDENENDIQRVRKITPTTIEITPISAWSNVIPDSALTALDQRIIKQDAQIKALEGLAYAFKGNMVDNLVYNESEDTLQLSANGVGVGNKVSVKDMLDDGIPVVDLDSNSGNENEPDNENKNENNCNCNHDCNCEDNVVEFGYSNITTEPTEDNNVVEF